MNPFETKKIKSNKVRYSMIFKEKILQREKEKQKKRRERERERERE
jgi:hypothetical protein